MPAQENGEHCLGSLLALAYPDRIARNRAAAAARFCWPMAAAAWSILRRRSRASRFWWWPNSPARRRRAASCWRRRLTIAEIEARFADQIEDRERVTFDAASGHLRARRSRRLGAVVLVRTDEAGRTRCRQRQAVGRRHRRTGHRQVAVEQGAASVAQSRDISCAGPKAMSGPICRRRRWRHVVRMAGAISRRQNRALADRRGRSGGGTRCVAAMESAQAARRRGADTFYGAIRLACADRLRSGRRAEAGDPRAGNVRPGGPSRRSPAAVCRF